MFSSYDFRVNMPWRRSLPSIILRSETATLGNESYEVLNVKFTYSGRTRSNICYITATKKIEKGAGEIETSFGPTDETKAVLNERYQTALIKSKLLIFRKLQTKFQRYICIRYLFHLLNLRLLQESLWEWNESCKRKWLWRSHFKKALFILGEKQGVK